MKKTKDDEANLAQDAGDSDLDHVLLMSTIKLNVIKNGNVGVQPRTGVRMKCTCARKRLLHKTCVKKKWTTC